MDIYPVIHTNRRLRQIRGQTACKAFLLESPGRLAELILTPCPLAKLLLPPAGADAR
jgi:hypothetical protein